MDYQERSKRQNALPLDAAARQEFRGRGVTGGSAGDNVGVHGFVRPQASLGTAMLVKAVGREIGSDLAISRSMDTRSNFRTPDMGK